MTIRRWLIGYRDDLDLASRWWHRLFKVLFALSAFVLWTIVLFGTHQKPERTVNNTRVLNNLYDYTMSHPGEANTFRGFQYQAYVGHVGPDGATIYPIHVWTDDVMCNADLNAHRIEVAHFLSREPMVNPNESAANWFAAHAPMTARTPDRAAILEEASVAASPIVGVCLVRAMAKLPETHQVIAYEFTTSAQIGTWALSVFFATLVLGVVSLGFLNFYYRAFLYVVCGERKSEATKATV